MFLRVRFGGFVESAVDSAIIFTLDSAIIFPLDSTQNPLDSAKIHAKRLIKNLI